MSGLVLAGDIHLARYVDGVLQGEHGPLNCTKLEVDPGQAEILERKSRKRDTYGQVLDSVTIPGSASVTIELDDAEPDVLQYALLGTLTDVAENSGTVVGERVTASLSYYKKLAHRGVSSVVVKTLPGVAPGTPPTIVGTGTGTMGTVTCGADALVGSYVVELTETSQTAAFTVTAPDGTVLAVGHVGSAYTSTHVSFTITAAGTMTDGDTFTIVTTGTTLVNGDDYSLDATAGMVKALSTGDINDGDDVQINYSYAAISGKKIIAGTNTEIRAQIRIDGKNLANQKKVDALIYEAVLTPSGALDPMGNKFVSFSIKGTMVTPTGRSGPMEYRELD